MPDNNNLTLGEKNALRAAASYLESSSFSYSGLVEQLKYEGYTDKEALFAVENINVDWNKQAASAAASYLESSAFSKIGLIEQLEYDGFTHEQALYGVKKVGY